MCKLYMKKIVCYISTQEKKSLEREIQKKKDREVEEKITSYYRSNILTSMYISPLLDSGLPRPERKIRVSGDPRLCNFGSCHRN